MTNSISSIQKTTRFRKLPKEIDAVQLNWKNW